MNTARNFHWLYCRVKACCYPHLPIPLSMKCSKSSVASTTDRNGRPSFSGAIGGHSSPENSSESLHTSIQVHVHDVSLWTAFTVPPDHHSTNYAHLLKIACACAQATHTHTHTHTHIPDSLLQILHTVIYTWSRCIRLWTLLSYFNKEKVHMHEGTYMHATANTQFRHLQFCKLHNHNLCTVRVADSAIKPYAYTATFNDCMIKTFLFSYTVCRGHKLTNSTCTHTQTHTTQRHNYHKFQEQHTSANHSATGTSSDNATNTYSELRTKAQAHLPCHPS